MQEKVIIALNSWDFRRKRLRIYGPFPIFENGAELEVEEMGWGVGGRNSETSLPHEHSGIHE